jgi:hypothetical protein
MEWMWARRRREPKRTARPIPAISRSVSYSNTTATLKKIINEIGKLPNPTRKVRNSREIEAFLHSLESQFTLPTIVVIIHN